MQPFRLDYTGRQRLERLEPIAAGLIRESAGGVDARAEFPRANLDALREAGLLGLVSAREVGGTGQGMTAAAAVVERIGRECVSTAMIVKMHYAATAVIEAHGPLELRRDIAAGKVLATLAFSESGSRSHFWVPVSTATRVAEGIRLDARKQLITSAGECDVYVWSSRPVAAEGLSTIWWVPARTDGLKIPQRYEGMGLRGNGSAPIQAEGAIVPEANRLGEDGQGFDAMMGVVLPWFSILNQAVSTGLSEGALERTVAHLTGSRYDYSGAGPADFPQVRANVARMRTSIDLCRALLMDALEAVQEGREDAVLRVLQAKAAGSETSLSVLDLAMRSSGGAAYRKDIALERYFRDSRAASVMAPVTDALWDFIGKATCGLPLFA